MEWHHRTCPKKDEEEIVPLAGKVMGNILWMLTNAYWLMFCKQTWHQCGSLVRCSKNAACNSEKGAQQCATPHCIYDIGVNHKQLGNALTPTIETRCGPPQNTTYWGSS